MLLACSAFNSQVGQTTLKAVFIERVTRFIDWPEGLFNENIEKFSLVVIGKHDFGPILDQIYSEYQIKDRDVTISYVDSVHKTEGAHIIFVGDLPPNQLKRLFNYCADKPILLISDKPGYKEDGLMLVYYLLDENLTFDINLSAVKQSGLLMSYHLLNRANVYEKVITD